MPAPPTNGHRILVYGRDSALLHTRQLVLACRGFQVDAVYSFEQLSPALNHADPPYELIVLCHTIPALEREKILSLIQNRDTGLFQLERMEAPSRLLEKVSEILPAPQNPSPGSSSRSTKPDWIARLRRIRPRNPHSAGRQGIQNSLLIPAFA